MKKLLIILIFLASIVNAQSRWYGDIQNSNGTFETGSLLPGWAIWGSPATIEISTVDKYSGLYSAHTICTPSTGINSSSFTSKIGVEYSYNYWIKVISGSVIVYKYFGTSLVAIRTITSASGWMNYQDYGVATGTSARIYFGSASGTSEFYLDNVFIKEVLFSSPIAKSKRNFVYQPATDLASNDKIGCVFAMGKKFGTTVVDISGNAKNGTTTKTVIQTAGTEQGLALSNSGLITVGNIGSIKTLALRLKLNSTTEKIIEGINNGSLVSASTGTLTQPFTTAYVNGVAGSTVVANQIFTLVLAGTSAIDFSNFKIGVNNTTYGNFTIYDARAYSTQWTTSQVTAYHNSFAKQVYLNEDFSDYAVGSFPREWNKISGTFAVAQLSAAEGRLLKNDKYLNCSSAGNINISIDPNINNNHWMSCEYYSNGSWNTLEGLVYSFTGSSTANKITFTMLTGDRLAKVKIQKGILNGVNTYPTAGLEWNSTANTYTRLGTASGQTRPFFDGIAPWKNLKRCNLSDAGVVNAYYGDVGYIEDGSNGQVMVEIPKFWYKTEITTTGYRWWISPVALIGFNLHPMFIRNGVIKNNIYIGAFEASVYDVSGSSYNTTDAAGIDFTVTTGDKLASISNAKPISGLNNVLDIASIRKIAQNRGTGWNQQDYLTTTALELLYLIEYGGFNSQSLLSVGVTNITDDAATNMAIYTGYTGTKVGGTNLGNASGEVSVTHYQTAEITKAMSYRGVENWYGNIWKFVDGINIKANNALWVADNGFTSDTYTAPYVNTNLVLCVSEGYVTNIKVNNLYNYQFLASTVGASTFVADYYYQTTGNRIAHFGGSWGYGGTAGGFYWTLGSNSGFRARTFGGRLLKY